MLRVGLRSNDFLEYILSKTRFLDITLLAIANVAEQFLFSEAYARKQGLLQSLDVRVKILSFSFLLVVTSLLHIPQALWILYGVSLILAALSRVPLGLFLKRVWFFVPLFSAAIVLPALLNVITPGEPVWVLLRLDHPYAWGPYNIPREIAITHQGIWGGIIFVSRVAASVSFAVLLTLTTRWADIFAGLRALFLPRVFVMTLGMTYRYLFVLLRLIQDMYRARKSRTISPFSASEERSWIASRVGFLFKRSLEMSQDIYRAMISRGYHGEVFSLNRFRASPGDYLWLVIIFLFGAIMLVFERNMFR
jgi:cobalt/nickel transport system permease protein